jgi:very-short-patch-repair endonuclease
MSLYNILKGHKCIECSYEERGKNCRNSFDYVENVINGINGNKLLNKEDYVGSKVRNLKVLCGKCKKHIFLVSFGDYCNVHVNQCRSCSSRESVGEKKIADYLDGCNIAYIREKKFDNCKDKRPLPFDFYIPKYNLVIEFDGQHHYYDVWGKNHFDKTQRHDKIKNGFCEENNIHLLRIPYWDGHNVNKLIDNKINNIIHR